MTMAGMIGFSFGIALALAAFTRVHAAACGCLLPFVATAAMFLIVRFAPSGSSTEAVAIPFAFIFVALGSIPGAMAGAGLRQLFSSRDDQDSRRDPAEP